MSSKMLGKLETVFSYMAHFMLLSWPEKRPGILFLTDSAGKVVTIMEMQVGQSWNPNRLDFQTGRQLCTDTHSSVFQALRTGEIAVHTSQDGDVVFGAFPLKEHDGRIRAVIGMAAPQKEIAFDLASYIRGLDSLIRMGYDAYIQHATTEIIMKLNRHDNTKDLLNSLIHQIADIIQKGYCSAIKLSEQGMLILPEYHTTEKAEDPERPYEITRLAARFAGEPLTPSVEDDYRTVILPITCEGKPLYVLFLHLSAEDAHRYDERDVAFLQEVGEKASYALLRTIVADDLRRDASKKDLLYQLMTKIQASIDVNDVLQEIINSIRFLYPHASVDLFLTVETNATIPVKPLSFHDDDASTSTRAYLEGNLVMDYEERDGATVAVLAAPLLGKQGIYGVLQLITDRTVFLSPHETEYISILAETAGKAFENAQLYQQSRNLIRELRLINEMARQLNRSLNLQEILDFVIDMLLETFSTEYCAILQKQPGQETFRVISSSLPECQGRMIRAEDSPVAEILSSKQALLLVPPGSEPISFSLFPCVSQMSFSSLMGVPLVVEGELGGVLIVGDSRHHFFSFDDYKLLEIFGQHASLAMTNAMLHNEVERMVITDNLTGLYTRRYLNERVQASLEKDSFGSLILIDIDYFKKVNDTYGHQVGDEVLIQVANSIKRHIRETDIPARWGGEELAVYLPRVDKATAHGIAERIRSYVEKETSPSVTISCGLAKWNRELTGDISVESLFYHADIALYEAKNKGRNQVILA
ncbi:diguanylate cyclase [Brevibacillus ruminantium]|uniref:Diguanylate cyclase n=1 Tax=Brevibacillus ruminantium TaxID=2950604 RepID=A0ABY4WMD5_9BACL|nr:diguanylate cyclase [Brevibacillus ruminantium]USG67202.1 diguanylate cyclase [Brevibacillus ruminantium]